MGPYHLALFSKATYAHLAKRLHKRLYKDNDSYIPRDCIFHKISSPFRSHMATRLCFYLPFCTHVVSMCSLTLAFHVFNILCTKAAQTSTYTALKLALPFIHSFSLSCPNLTLRLRHSHTLDIHCSD